MQNKPNIIIFNPDHFRGEALGHAGNTAVHTPNLDKIVKTDGVSFVNAFCQNTVCTPSRCSFMSGWYPHVRGHRTMHHMMREDEPVLLRTLKENGYFVWWGGKNDLIPAQNKDSLKLYCDVRYRGDNAKYHISEDGSWRGKPGSDTYYSFYFGKLDKGKEEFYHDSDWDNVLAAVEFIKNRPKDKPFCIFLALQYPHPPFAVEEPWYSMTDKNKLPKRIPEPDWKDKPSMSKGIVERSNMKKWSEERWTELRATYYGMCSRIDHQFGLLVKALADAGLYDDTALYFFSDHGMYTGDYGLTDINQNTFEDAQSRVPLIIKPPKSMQVKPGIRNAMVELVDFPATVHDMLGIVPEHWDFGRSLNPLIAGKTESHRDAVFCEGGRLHGEKHCMELESPSSTDPKGLYWPRLSLQATEGPEHTKAVMCRTGDYKYVQRLYEKDELYDLKKDPEELHNRIDDPLLA